MTPWLAPLSYWLADLYFFATIVLLAVGAAMAALKQPARRLSVGWSALGGLAVLLVLSVTPSWPRIGVLHETVISAPVAESGVAIRRSSQSIAPQGEPPDALHQWPNNPPSNHALSDRLLGVHAPVPSAARAASPLDRLPAWSDLIGGSYLAGGVLMLVWLALGSLQTARLRRRARPAPESSRAVLARVVDSGRAEPELLLCDDLRQPVALGLLHPTIILPERFLEAEPENRLAAALSHEWAHIRNRDLWLIALSRLLLPFLYAHPGYWWLRRLIRDDQEALADAAAAAERQVEYAEVLLSWAKDSPAPPLFAAGGSLALWERPSQLRKRIGLLLDRSFRVETNCPKWWRRGVRTGVALGVLALSLLTLRPTSVQADPPRQPAQQEVVKAKSETAPTSNQTARVVDPDGQPVAGAKVYISERRRDLKSQPGRAVLVSTTNSEGSCTLPELPTAVDRQVVRVVATAEGYGAAFLDPSVSDGPKLLRLVKDDVPITGRVLDIQGRPVAGASVQLVGLNWHPSGSLDEWADARKAENPASFTPPTVSSRMMRSWSSDEIPSLFPAVITDGEGRFTLKGIGRERIASLVISGPGIETRFENVVTRSMPLPKNPVLPAGVVGQRIAYRGAEGDFVAGPGFEVAGTVTDKDTGRPLAGITVQTTVPFGTPPRFLKATTDAEGRYRLSGIPPVSAIGRPQELIALSEDGPPYLACVERLAKPDGALPVTSNFTLKRGLWARGRVIDRSTGKPLQANLEYYVPADNPFLKEYPGFGTVMLGMPFTTDTEGRFQMVVMPGPGVIGARSSNDHYRTGIGIEKVTVIKPGAVPTKGIAARPRSLVIETLHAVAGIDPRPGDESVTCDLELDPGIIVKGKIVGPDGEPITGARIWGIIEYAQGWSTSQGWSLEPLPSAEFEIFALSPGSKRTVLFHHQSKKLAGSIVVSSDQEGPVTARLQPWGTLTGRLVDAAGLPLAETRTTFSVLRQAGEEQVALSFWNTTEIDGRFRIEGLRPGAEYNLTVSWGRGLVTSKKYLMLGEGETKDLGDIKIP